MVSRASTRGQLIANGYESRSIRDEMRANTVARLRAGQPIFPELHGYDETVVPQVVNAILAGHDILLLGERGQAKSRLARSLTALLDEWTPIISGSEVNDDPLNPISAYGKHQVEAYGDATPIRWVHRDERFAEKLATPDTSIADLIGEVDPIKIAEGRYLSNEEIIAFGLIPRTNRGIFNLNELPDLAERIQVGLLNILEERDVQIRGFSVRLPLDILVVASANPEDYTNRGRIITPLKDRFGSQIRTHYPSTIEQELDIVHQEQQVAEIDGVTVLMPSFMANLIAAISHVARSHPQVNAKSGVSVRMTIANYEAIVANAQRRAIISNEPLAVPGVSDLLAIRPATMGKIELDTWDQADDDRVFDDIIGRAILQIGVGFEHEPRVSDIQQRITEGAVIRIDSTIPAQTALHALGLPGETIDGAIALAQDDRPAAILAALGFALEYLYRRGDIARTPDGFSAL
ncbi:MAG: sigma 54-interacting transcriptional regulator [Thermomicrobiales bacterium]|nr:sigma 54-interacting transcriptional regulator [Thermomicrobiales bacterium]